MYHSPKRQIAISVTSTAVVLICMSGCTLMNRQYVSTARHARSTVAARRSTTDYRDDETVETAAARGQSPTRPSSGAEEGNYGAYVGGGSSVLGLPAATGTVGAFKMIDDCVTTRIGVLGADINGIGAGGVETGIRYHTRDRFSPYVGLQGDLAFSGLHHGRVVHSGAYNKQPRYAPQLAGLAAIAPEAGVSYWLNSTTRLNAGANYFIAANEPNFVVYTVSLDFVLGSRYDSTTSSSPVRSEPSLDYVESEPDPVDDVKDLLQRFHLSPRRLAEMHSDAKTENANSPEETGVIR